LQALRTVEPLLEDNALQVEAARAAMKIAAALPTVAGGKLSWCCERGWLPLTTNRHARAYRPS